MYAIAMCVLNKLNEILVLVLAIYLEALVTFLYGSTIFTSLMTCD